MKSLFVLVVLIVIFMFVVPFIQTYVMKYLNYLDRKKEYSNFNFKVEKEGEEFYIEYLVWQDNKLCEIIRRYSEVIIYNNQEYEVIEVKENIGFPNRLHFNKKVVFIVK